jgi:hypothetical protein
MRHFNEHFSIIGEEKTEKIGTKHTKMPVAWLDIPRNSPGPLAAGLSITAEAFKRPVTHIRLSLSKESRLFYN